MPEINPYPGSKVSKREFDQFVLDLYVLLKFISQELVAKWLKMDAGNFSKKVRGVKGFPINSTFLAEFYRVLSASIEKLRNNVPPYEVIREMNKAEEEERYNEDLHKEIRMLKETVANQSKILADQAAAIKILQAAVFGGKDCS